MCGIAGQIRFDGKVEPAVIERMGEAIAHRGPDGKGLWHEAGAGFVHRRLSIIDLTDGGRQPMHSVDGRFVLTYNGEIYNYLELRKDLEGKGHAFRTASDSEVLLAAYAEWGSKCLERFNGMWAFTIWDRKESRLFAARDRFGKKPFYYQLDGKLFSFASEIKALLAAGTLRAEVNHAVLGDFAADRVLDFGPETCFKGVLQLPAGHALELQSGVVNLRRYWAIPLKDATSREPSIEELRDLFKDAVSLRMRADVPVGSLLSGGLDSSYVTLVAAGIDTREFHAFSTLTEPRDEEASGIDLVATASRSIRLHQDRIPEAGVLEEIDACIWHQEEPFADGSMLAHFRLMRLARDAGVKTLLSGQGADEVFGGYPSVLAEQLAGFVGGFRWGSARRFAQEIRARRQAVSAASVVGRLLPSVLQRAIRRSRARREANWLIPEISRGARWFDQDECRTRFAGVDRVNRLLRECLAWRTLPGFLHYEDRNSMAFGIETRLPFLDFRLVEKALPITGAVKLAAGRTKDVLRKLARQVVPDPIIERTAKSGYPAPIGTWLRTFHGKDPGGFFRTPLDCPLIDGARWTTRLQGFLAGDETQLAAVWRGLVIARWYDRFFRRPVSG